MQTSHQDMHLKFVGMESLLHEDIYNLPTDCTSAINPTFESMFCGSSTPPPSRSDADPITSMERDSDFALSQLVGDVREVGSKMKGQANAIAKDSCVAALSMSQEPLDNCELLDDMQSMQLTSAQPQEEEEVQFTPLPYQGSHQLSPEYPHTERRKETHTAVRNFM